MESTTLSKANHFLYSLVTFQQNQVKGKKKRPIRLLVTEIERVVQNSALETGRTTYVWESRVPLCLNSDWTWDWVKARTQD